MTHQGKPQDTKLPRRSDSEMWDRMAEWWDDKQGEDGDLWHRLLIEPPFERVIGEVNGCASWRSPAATAASPGACRAVARALSPSMPPKP
jgi:hypothetical protein